MTSRGGKPRAVSKESKVSSTFLVKNALRVLEIGSFKIWEISLQKWSLCSIRNLSLSAIKKRFQLLSQSENAFILQNLQNRQIAQATAVVQLLEADGVTWRLVDSGAVCFVKAGVYFFAIISKFRQFFNLIWKMRDRVDYYLYFETNSEDIEQLEIPIRTQLEEATF